MHAEGRSAAGTAATRWRRLVTVEHGAALWALVFAAFHFIWAGGWYIGLDPVAARGAFAVTWKLIYDLVAGALCVVAVGVALALPRPRRLPNQRRWGSRAANVFHEIRRFVRAVTARYVERLTW